MCHMQRLGLLALPVARITVSMDRVSGSQHIQRLLDTVADHAVTDERHEEGACLRPHH